APGSSLWVEVHFGAHHETTERLDRLGRATLRFGQIIGFHGDGGVPDDLAQRGLLWLGGCPARPGGGTSGERRGEATRSWRRLLIVLARLLRSGIRYHLGGGGGRRCRFAARTARQEPENRRPTAEKPSHHFASSWFDG